MTFGALLCLELTRAYPWKPIPKAAAFTFLIGFGPFSGQVADSFIGNGAGLIALGTLTWLAIAVLVWRTRAGTAHWMLYAGAISTWLAVGFVVLAYHGRGV